MKLQSDLLNIRLPHLLKFHLPKSTLLMLVSAFVGDRKFLLKCYDEAVEEKYRFFSFGDAMLIE